jgi:hypothetical protein
MHKYKVKLIALVSLLAMLAIGLFVTPAHASDAALAASIDVPNVGNWHEAKAPGKWRFSGNDKKSPAPSPFTGPGYYHAGGFQGLTSPNSAGGLAANIYNAKPFIPASSCVSGGDHSLMEMAMKTATGDVVEFGWAVEPTAFGDCKPRLFGSTWKGTGTGSGVWNGCYDAHTPSCWFIDNTANPVNLGSDLSATASLCNGTSLGCVKKYLMYYSTATCGPAASGIRLDYDNVNVGCFYSPAFYSGTSSTWVTFQAFGEYYYAGPNKPCGDMGNGVSPSTALGNTGPSYFGSISLANPSPSTLLTAFSTSTSTDAPAYDIGPVLGGRTFATSGAGYTGTPPSQTTPGLVGAC